MIMKIANPIKCFGAGEALFSGYMAKSTHALLPVPAIYAVIPSTPLASLGGAAPAASPSPSSATASSSSSPLVELPIPLPTTEHDRDNVYITLMEDVGEKCTPLEFCNGVTLPTLTR
jgi:hypothetical protein